MLCGMAKTRVCFLQALQKLPYFLYYLIVTVTQLLKQKNNAEFTARQLYNLGDSHLTRKSEAQELSQI